MKALTLVCLLMAGYVGIGRADVSGSPTVIHPPKVIHLRNGSVVTVAVSGRVVVRSRHGQVLSDSWCGSSTRYWRWVTFMTALQDSIRQGNRAAVASQIAYPLLWTSATAKTTIRTRHEFLLRYADIFRPGVVKAVLAADPHALFCQNVTQASIGSGVIWGDVFGRRLAITTINPPVRS